MIPANLQKASLQPEDREARWQLREANDCTVRATALALRMPYVVARAKLGQLGRKPRRGFTFREPVVKALGFEALPEYSCRSWASVKASLPATGAFVVRIRRHVFAVVDGVPSETDWSPRTQVRMVYAAPSQP